MSQEPHQLAGGITPEPPVDMLPTHVAVTKNDVDKLAELADKGGSLVDPNSQETVLHAAVRAGAKKAAEYILSEKLVSPTALSATGHSAAHYAALYHQLDILKTILKSDRKLSDQLDETGLSLLSLATLGGNKEMAVWLLEEYPDLVNTSNNSGNYAVHFAAAQGQLEILKLIVEKCGQEMVEKPDTRQTKPVYFAAQEGRLKVLDYLINELGVDGVAREKGGMSSVHAATQGSHPTTVKWLVGKLGVSYILDKTIDGATPLHMAAAQGNLDILQFFLDKLENENDVNVQDNISATPAHDAAEYGQTQAMILLLKAGADLTIQDVESKTPYQLAAEQEHHELVNMLTDYHKGGLSAISKYEKKKKRSREESKERTRGNARTSRQEAMELSSVIQATAEVVDKMKEQNLQRQESLQRMNEVGLDDESKDHGNSGHSKHQARGGFSDEDNDIEHHFGPLGGVYARPNKKANHSKTSSKHNSDIEDFIDETMSHRSYTSNKHRTAAPYHLPGLEDGPYATVNHETASNISRPSRVKRYHDSDSEVSSFAGSAGHFYNSGRYPMPMGGGYGQFPPPLPPPRGSRGGPRSVASSKQSSQYSGHRMPYGGMPYGYPPNMMGYYGYPPYGQGYPPQHYGMPMYGPPMGLYLQRHRLHHQQKAGRKVSLLNRKKKKGPAPNYDASAEHSDTQTPRKHTDQDMGYGPTMLSGPSKSREDHTFHPPAPPITHMDGTMETNDVVTHDSNFIMAKRSGDTLARRIGDTTLNPTQTQRNYDGRYDKYIMTDSEPEMELPDHVGVACAAEAAAIIAIGCVAGLKGLAKMRKEPSKGVKSHSNKAALSSAWDEAQDLGQGGKKSKHNTSLDDPLLKGMSPEEFASHEEWDKSDWNGASERAKKKRRDKVSEEVNSRSTEPVEPQSDLLAAELQKYASASVSKSLGQQILSSSLGARHSSMLNIASSAAGSRMSLNASSGEEDDDNDFNAAISIVTGTPLRDKVKPKQKALDLSTISKGDEEKVEKPIKKESNKKKEKDIAAAEAKKKEKKEKKEQKAREKEQKVKERTQAKKDKKEKEAAIAAEKKAAIAAEKEAAIAAEKEAAIAAEKEAAIAAEKKAAEKKAAIAAEKKAAEKKAAIAAEKKAAEKKAAIAAEKKAKETKARPLISPTTALKKEEPKAAPPEEPKQLKPSQVKTKVEVKTVEKPIPPSAAAQSSADKKPQGKALPPQSSTNKTPNSLAPKASKSAPKSSEPVEVENEVTMFDTESESEDEQQITSQTSPKGQSSTQPTKTTGGFDLTFGFIPPPPLVNQPDPVNYIEMDDESLDIFGADGLAELNDALRELTNIESSFTDLSNLPTNDVTMTTEQRESQGAVMSKGGGGVRKTSSGGGIDVSMSGGRGRVIEARNWVNAPKNIHPKVQTEGVANTQTNYLTSTETEDAKIQSSTKTQTNGVSTVTAFTSTAVQGDGYASSFEQNVLRILQGLTDTMQQMRANPSITQTEIKQQEMLQQQMIQNLISYSENNPQLTSKLLSMLKNEQTPTDNSDSTKSAFEMLEQKLLQTQELQSRHAQDYFRTQEEFQHVIQKKLEEQAEQQLKLIQSNFEKYSQLLNENQSKKKKKKRKKNKKSSKWSEEGSSGSSESDDGLVQPMKQTSISKPEVKTMQAKIYHQDLLEEDSMKSSSQTSLTGKLREKKMSRDMLKRQNTSHSFDMSQEAWKRFESNSTPIDEDNEEDDEMQHALPTKPVTLKRADIMKIRDEVKEEEKAKKAGVVRFVDEQQRAEIRKIGPSRAKGPPQTEKPLESFDIKYGHHVETNEHKKNLTPEDVTIAGAGGELSRVLQLRQQQISNKH